MLFILEIIGYFVLAIAICMISVSFAILICSKPPKKIILLSLPRCNGTIILRAFGQDLRVQIYNEHLTYFHYDDPKFRHYNHHDKNHYKTVSKMIKNAQKNDQITIYHEMAGDISYLELKKLKSAGFTIVFVARNPRAQLASLMKILEPNLIKHDFEIGWTNVQRYHDCGLIDFAINSQAYLVDVQYRASIHTILGLNITEKMLSNMTRYHGKKFHEICNITSSWLHPTDEKTNKWNAKAGSSLTLRKDSFADIEEIPVTLQSSLNKAEYTYNTIAITY